MGGRNSDTRCQIVVILSSDLRAVGFGRIFRSSGSGRISRSVGLGRISPSVGFGGISRDFIRILLVLNSASVFRTPSSSRVTSLELIPSTSMPNLCKVPIRANRGGLIWRTGEGREREPKKRDLDRPVQLFYRNSRGVFRKFATNISETRDEYFRNSRQAFRKLAARIPKTRHWNIYSE